MVSFLVLAGACGGGVGRLVLDGLRAGPGCGERWEKAEDVGSIPGDLKEVSGFVASGQRPGVAWMVRDSGNPAVLYSFELAGDGTVRTREHPVEGATNGDWEDVAYTTDGDGRGHVWILDNVDRHTAPKTIWEVLEPGPGADGPVRLAGRYRWEYPDGDGNHDTETLLPLDGQLTVVSKTIPSVAYRFEEPLEAGRVNRPARLGEVTGPNLVFASTSGDDGLVLSSSMRSDTVYVAGRDRWVGGRPAYSQQMKAAQREAGDFFPHGGCDIVLLDEREHVWLLRNR